LGIRTPREFPIFTMRAFMSTLLTQKSAYIVATSSRHVNRLTRELTRGVRLSYFH
jgi:hypothetical protein